MNKINLDLRELQLLYKRTNIGNSSTQSRMQSMKTQRTQKRADLAFQRRNIPANLTPAASPAPLVKPVRPTVPSMTRAEKLAKWKADKNKAKADKKQQQKPLFKVSAINVPLGLPNLTQFITPSTSQSINNTKIGNKRAVNQKTEKKVKVERPINASKMRTRSQAKLDAVAAPVAKLQEEIAQQEIPKATTPDKSALNEPLEEKTPKKTNVAPVYISPFVTLSRGKDRARKEYHARKSGTGSDHVSPKTDYEECSGPKAGAAHFTHLLDREIAGFETVCETWEQYKADNELHEEAIAMIDVAIGQTRLLIAKKFQQFRGLIENCVHGGGEGTVTTDDLHGFWDMIYIQVVNLNARYKNLERLKLNGWEEVLPEKKTVAAKKKGKGAKKVKASSAIRDAIKLARMKKQEENQKSPVNDTNRLSIVRSSSRFSSPGIAMMRVSQIAKTMEDCPRSILKSKAKTPKDNLNKTVLFQVESDDENDGNLYNLELSIKDDDTGKPKTPIRHSRRLSRAKLF